MDGYRIAERKAWVPLHRHCESVDELLARLRRACDVLRDALSSQTVRGAMLYLRYGYAADVCRCEGIADFDIDYIESMVACDPCALDAAARSGYNVYHAMPFVLDRSTEFTAANIRALHAKVGLDLIPGAGEYRTRPAAPIGSCHIYRHPTAIASSLDALVRRTTDAMPFDSDEHAILVSSAFVADFLAIHPFTDGNGRVARLCLSWLVKERFVVPISLASGGHDASRDTFLMCLESPETRKGQPKQLARFVLECAVDTALAVAFCADVAVD